MFWGGVGLGVFLSRPGGGARWRRMPLGFCPPGAPPPAWEDEAAAPQPTLRRLSPLQCVRRRAGQAPDQTRRSVVKVSLTVEAPLRHRLDDRAAEATPLRL